MKKTFTTLFLASLALIASATQPGLPDPIITPGATNPDVTQDNIQQTICQSGWTKTIRPSSSFTTKLKIQQLRALGLIGSASEYEEDHLISLELGGSPKDPKNLWPQPWDGEWGAHKKDVIETRLKRLVCTGAITLKEAQTTISTDWIAAYKKYIIVKK